MQKSGGQFTSITRNKPNSFFWNKIIIHHKSWNSYHIHWFLLSHKSTIWRWDQMTLRSLSLSQLLIHWWQIGEKSLVRKILQKLLAALQILKKLISPKMNRGKRMTERSTWQQQSIRKSWRSEKFFLKSTQTVIWVWS